MDPKIPPLASKQLEPLLTPLSDIKPHPDNYKIHTPEQLASLRASLNAFGCTQPIKVNLEGYIVAGHGMYQLYQEEGFTHAPVIYEALDKRLSKAYLVADNETARRAETDSDKLALLLQDAAEIPDFDIEAVGFEEYELDKLLAEPLEFQGSLNNDKNGSQNINSKNIMPDDFQEFDENIETTHKCPKCGYEY